MNAAKISTWQAVILLFLSRAFSVLNYIPILHVETDGTAMLIGTVCSFAVQLIIMIPIFILYSRFEGKNILDIAFLKSKVFGVIMTVLYILVLTIFLIQSTFEFSFFIVNAVYPDAPLLLIIFSIALVCTYCAKNGLESIARVSSIVFVFFIMSTIFIVASSIPTISFLNITPILGDPVKSVFKYTFWHVANSPELLIFFLIVPKIRKNIKAVGIWYIIISLLFTLLIVFLTLAVLGDVGFIQTFPVYTLTAILEVNFLQRLDILYMLAWVFLSFIKQTLITVVAEQSLRKVVTYRVSRFFPITIFTVTVISAFFIGKNIDIYKKIMSFEQIIYLLFMIVLPILLLIITKKKEGENNEKNNSVVSSDTVLTVDSDVLH